MIAIKILTDEKLLFNYKSLLTQFRLLILLSALRYVNFVVLFTNLVLLCLIHTQLTAIQSPTLIALITFISVITIEVAFHKFSKFNPTHIMLIKLLIEEEEDLCGILATLQTKSGNVSEFKNDILEAIKDLNKGDNLESKNIKLTYGNFNFGSFILKKLNSKLKKLSSIKTTITL